MHRSNCIASLDHLVPASNATGFTLFEFSVNAKLLELLKEVAPSVKRVAVVRDPFVAATWHFLW